MNTSSPATDTLPPPVIDPAWRAHLESLFPASPLLRPDQVAEICNLDLATIRRLCERPPSGGVPQLMGPDLNASGTTRVRRRIYRDSAMLFYARRANYTPGEFLFVIRELLTQRSVPELTQLQRQIVQLIRKKAAATPPASS